ncbi:hypothetical protein K438DRAFT_1802605 [Mycena galopus ATCC 62051]|nr:hypothetical protein K438DRAFT_1802605 [Mycena galopus ATCC 62051]
MSMSVAIQIVRSRLAELDAQIIEQRRVLYDLEQARFDVERILDAIATYPVLTLPTEITAEIFASCLSAFDPLSIPPATDEISAPLVLAGVCRAWRDIAFTTPILWSKLRVKFDSIPIEVVSKPGLVEGRIDRWLARAGHYPLSLDFRSSRKHHDPFALSRLGDIILRWSDRVQHLDINIGKRRDIRALGLDSAAFPLLQDASLRCGAELDPDVQLPVVVFGNAPRLHDLNLLFGLGVLTAAGFTLPWLQLTSFEGTISNLSIFTLAPNLTEITCSFEPDEDDFVAITHRSLRSLTIGKDSGDLIHYLTLPALRSLDASSASCYDCLEPFLRRSSPPLTSLFIQGKEAYLDYFCECIPLVARTLETLGFLDVDDSEELECILALLDGSILDSLPNIQTLSFKDLDGPFGLHALLCFLYARSHKVRTFRVVWAFDPFLDRILRAGPPGFHYFDTIRDHFARLGQSGMEIYSKVADDES